MAQQDILRLDEDHISKYGFYDNIKPVFLKRASGLSRRVVEEISYQKNRSRSGCAISACALTGDFPHQAHAQHGASRPRRGLNFDELSTTSSFRRSVRAQLGRGAPKRLSAILLIGWAFLSGSVSSLRGWFSV